MYTIESSYNMSDVEGQLLSVYDPRVIKDILTELYEHRRLNAAQILSLNDKVGFHNFCCDSLPQ